jgi:uncharacterized protein with PQ loop repeat
MEKFLGTWCVLLSFSFIWPQVWRVVRHDTSHGISPFGLMHGIVGSALWLSYGILQSDTAVWFSNTSFCIAQSIIIAVTYRHGRIPRPVIIQVALACLAILISTTVTPAAAVGYIAIVVSGSSIFPQLIHVIKTDNLHGLSLSSLALSAIACSSWLWYGFVVSDMMISAQNFVTVPIFIFMMYKAWTWRVENGVPIFASAK